MRPLMVVYFLLFVFVSHGMGQVAVKTGLKISSPAFENNGQIPSKYTCDGPNLNPLLNVENVPPNAKSLALVFDDMDAPRGSYVHWILWNIDPGVKEIQENSIPEGAVQGLNDFKKNNYGGPCPPTRAHRYVFRVYALDLRLTLESRSTKVDLEKAIKGHILSQAQIVGSYKRVAASKK